MTNSRESLKPDPAGSAEIGISARKSGPSSYGAKRTVSSHGGIEMREQVSGFSASGCEYGEFQSRFPQLTILHSSEHPETLHIDRPPHADDCLSYPELDRSPHALDVSKMFKHSTRN